MLADQVESAFPDIAKLRDRRIRSLVAEQWRYVGEKRPGPLSVLTELAAGLPLELLDVVFSMPVLLAAVTLGVVAMGGLNQSGTILVYCLFVILILLLTRLRPSEGLRPSHVWQSGPGRVHFLV